VKVAEEGVQADNKNSQKCGVCKCCRLS